MGNRPRSASFLGVSNEDGDYAIAGFAIINGTGIEAWLTKIGTVNKDQTTQPSASLSPTSPEFIKQTLILVVVIAVVVTLLAVALIKRKSTRVNSDSR